MKTDKNLLFVFIGLSFIMALGLPLVDNEIYYNFLARNLDWSFFDHPPLLMSAIYLVEKLSFNLLGIRFLSMSSWVLSLFLFYKWTAFYMSKEKSLLATVCMSSCLALLGTSFLVFPDIVATPLILGSFVAIHSKRFWLAGLLVGLAGLGKWNAVLATPYIFMVVLDFCLKEKSYKPMIGLCKTALLAGLCQFPQLYWNYQNEWASFQFHLQDRYSSKKSGFMDYLEKSLNIVFILLVSGLPLAWTLFNKKIFLGMKSGFIKNRALWVGFACATLPFVMAGLKGQMRLYWFGLSWVFLIPLIVQNMSPSLAVYLKKTQKLYVGLLAFVLILALLPVPAMLKAHEVFPLKYHLKLNIRGALLGWDQWRNIPEIKAALSDKSYGFVTSNYRIAGRSALYFGDAGIPGRIRAVGHPHGLKFIGDNKISHEIEKLVLYADSRFKANNWLDKYCVQKPQWKNHKVFQFGYHVKDIKWAVCEKRP